MPATRSYPGTTDSMKESYREGIANHPDPHVMRGQLQGCYRSVDRARRGNTGSETGAPSRIALSANDLPRIRYAHCWRRSGNKQRWHFPEEFTAAASGEISLPGPETVTGLLQGPVPVALTMALYHRSVRRRSLEPVQLPVYVCACAAGVPITAVANIAPSASAPLASSQ